MSIYTPYTYFLYHIPTGKKYYGSKTASKNQNQKLNANPLTFWKDYFTSSKEVKRLIQLHGKDSFRYKIHKIFKTAEEAILYEEYVLRYFNVLNRKDWINNNINGRLFLKEKSKEWKQNISNSKKDIGKGRKRNVYWDNNCKKQWFVYYPDGSCVTLKGLRTFCKENNLHYTCMRDTAFGKQSNHKGFYVRLCIT